MKTLGAAIALVVTILAPAGWAQEQDFFYSEGRKIPLLVSRDQVGVLLRDPSAVAALRDTSSSLQLRVVEELPSGVVILAAGQRLDRPKLAALARDVARRAERVVAKAGFVVRMPETKTPMIVTDEFVVQFKPDVSRDQVEAFNRGQNVTVVMENPFVKNQFLLAVRQDGDQDALRAANRYHGQDIVEFSHPNFVKVLIQRQAVPNDPLFPNQWHHQNTGQGGGTQDADVDSDPAWGVTTGAAANVIAVIDFGFDTAHPDLVPNLWQNPGEIAGNGMDDDGNGFVDDVNGWDFTGCDAMPGPGCGDANLAGNPHGTSAAGVAAARGNNNVGVSGACRDCGLMLLLLPNSDFAQAMAFGYAQQEGAQIITNSWGFAVGTPCTSALCGAINAAAMNGRGGLGSIVLFAMNNGNVNDCTGANPDISSLANVIAVSASSNQDRKVTESAFGNCMELLAPTHRGYGGGTPYSGTLNIVTTDVSGNGGYNNAAPIGGDPTRCPVEGPDRDYTNCFGGTSSATPLTAGVTGLVLSARPALTRIEVQRVLQDTADKIQDSAGRYARTTGFSTPATGNATHGWGRVNAFEAVRVVAPPAQGGHGGVDLLMRDNRLDWGNTEQASNVLQEPVRGFIPHWESEDVKVDAPPYQAVPTAATFDAFVDETPSAAAGDVNRAFVRVRNRGPVTAGAAVVKLHWSQFGTALPALPMDFWTAFPADSTDTTQWHPLACAGGTSSTCALQNVAYSGSSVATTATDAALIAQFDFPAPPIDPNLANHFCLLAMVDSAADPISAASHGSFVVDGITPTDNNVTHRNYVNLDTTRAQRFEERFFVRNPTEKAVRVVLKLEAPRGWEAQLNDIGFGKVFPLEPKQERLLTMRVSIPKLGDTGDVRVLQERVDTERPEAMGGLTLRLRPLRTTAAARR